MNIEIRVSLKKLTIGDLVSISRGDVDAVIRVGAACMIDPSTGDYYQKEDQPKLQEFLRNEIPLDQFDALSIELSEKISEARKATIPPG